MKKIISLLALFALAQSGYSAGFQASLTPDIALVNQGALVEGVALNIWGDNEVRGLDLGFVNQQSGSSKGFTISLLGGTVHNYSGVVWGGIFTKSTGDVVGWQAAAINISSGSIKGLQSGWVNIAQNMRGVQLGLVNYAKNAYGVQVGFVNIIESNEWFQDLPNDLAKGFPIVNWSF